MRRYRDVGVLGAAITMAVVVFGGSAQAAPVDVRVENLERGADARVLYADDTWLHTLASGLVPMPASDHEPTEHMRLMGKSASGWVTWHSELGGEPLAYRHTLYEVEREESPTVLYERAIPWEEYNDFDEWYGLSESGKRVVEWLADEGSGPVTVRNLDGDVVAEGGPATRILDFSGPRMAYLMDSRAHVWRIGHKPSLVTNRTSNFAELQHDVVFLETPDGRFGPTRLSNPGAVRWKAPFDAVRLSPDGTRVLGRRHDSSVNRPVFQIRRMSNGAVMSSFKAGNPQQDIAWEGNKAVLLPQYGADGKIALVRCTIAGRCTRASDWIESHDGLSFPFTPQY